MVARDNWVAPKTSGSRMIREKCLASMTPLVYQKYTTIEIYESISGTLVHSTASALSNPPIQP